MTIGDANLLKLYQFSSFAKYLKNLLPGTGLPQRKEITIKTRTLIQSLTAAGLAVSISLPVLAEEINPNNAPTPAERMEHMTDMPPGGLADKHREMRDKWQKMSPEERKEQRKAMHDHWEKMSPEEREQMHKRMKEHWKSMPPEEREERRKEMREHFKNMSPEERQQFKRDMGRDGMPLPDDDRPGGKADGAGRPVQQ
jgi:hypothetical protein